jgi:hypothetical protein
MGGLWTRAIRCIGAGEGAAPSFAFQPLAMLCALLCALRQPLVVFGDFDHQWGRFIVLDLIELNGQDLRREPIEVRKRELASLLRAARIGLQNEHLVHPGDGEALRASQNVDMAWTQRMVMLASFRPSSPNLLDFFLNLVGAQGLEPWTR